MAESVSAVRVAVVGDFDAAYPSHPATDDALALAAASLGAAVDVTWVPTEAVAASGAEMLAAYDGIWSASGSPYRSMEGQLAAIRFAREQGRPLVAT
jgi:CTP synthase (UTP-ammonia lyase)